jgi:1-acyl-sn-glycerol-3-phosphate acyltransferase
VGVTLARRGRRSLLADSATLSQCLAGRWAAEGLEHVPAHGPVCLVVNHWQRPGLWIGWGGALIGWLVGRRRGGADPPVRWLVLADLRLTALGRERHIRIAGYFIARAAYAWGMVPLSLAPRAAGRRAAALRALRDAARRGEVIGFFPEGYRGAAGPLGQAAPGATRVLAWLAAAGVALVPVALYEAQGKLQVRFGAALRVAAGEVEPAVMPALAALLPAALRGAWAGAVAHDAWRAP